MRAENGYPRPEHQEGESGAAAASLAADRRKILVVSQEPSFSEAISDYAIHLAERLGYELLVVKVGPEPTIGDILYSSYRRYLQDKFQRRAEAHGAALATKARKQGVALTHQVIFGHPQEVVDDLYRSNRRLEFVLNASEMNKEAITEGVPTPVFDLAGEPGASNPTAGGKLNVATKTMFWGLAATALYAAVFMNSNAITMLFAKGGWFAALPIATVFVFSFVHGTFAHHVWELLGIHAPQHKVQPRPTAAKRPAARKRPRPRVRLNV